MIRFEKDNCENEVLTIKIIEKTNNVNLLI